MNRALVAVSATLGSASGSFLGTQRDRSSGAGPSSLLRGYCLCVYHVLISRAHSQVLLRHRQSW
eukprot:scaffold270_cov390-Prasinococcus_capsulatus_cf.AAC.16